MPGYRARNQRIAGSIAVLLNDVALSVLRRRVAKHPKRSFTFRGKPVRAANIHAWQNALKHAGIEDFCWHDLRHTWATCNDRLEHLTHEFLNENGPHCCEPLGYW